MDDFARKYPAFLMFSAVCTVCIPGLLLQRSGFSVFYTSAIAVGCLAVIAFFLFSVKNACWRILLPACLAACSMCCHNLSLEREPLLERFYGAGGYGEGIFRITDDSMVTGIPFLKQKRGIRTVLLKYRPSPDAAWENLHSEVLYVLPVDHTGTQLGYGDILHAKGKFLRPARAVDPQSFDYRQWLETQNIFYEFREEEKAELFKKGIGFHRILYDLRNKLLTRICQFVPDPEIKALIPGLFFGLRSTEPETLQHFRTSGMIHIISVSGTHVSLFALVLFLIMAPLPYRWRYFCVILLTFFYAESTGMRIPAFRAFMMFALYCGLRMLHKKTLTFNTLFLAALILTLLDPGAVLQAGFQFSFLCVAALLLLSCWQKNHAVPESERMLMTPSRMISTKYVMTARFTRHFVQMILSCIIAWLISLPLTLYHQGVWATGTPAANFFSLPFITLSFVFFAGCCLFSLITPVLQCFAWLLTASLQVVCAIAESFSGTGDWMSRPALWLVLLFTGTVLVFLCSRKKRFLFLSGILAFFLLFHWHLQQVHRKGEVLFFSDGTQYSLCIYTPENKSVNVISLPDKNFAYHLLQSCYTRQAERCHFLILPDSRKNAREAAKYFSEKLPVLTGISRRHGGDYSAVMKLHPEEVEPFFIYRSNALQCIYRDQFLLLRHILTDNTRLEFVLREEPYAISLEIFRDGKPVIEHRIPSDGKGIRLFSFDLEK